MYRLKKLIFLSIFIIACLALYYTIPHAYDSTAKRPQKSLVVVITSYNNKTMYQRNLNSVFSQDYSNYRVIYIDDASPDGTGDLVERYVKEKKQEHRVTLIKNKTWQSQMANHYKAAHMCEDHEIIVHLDGDDWLAHSNVFNLLNDIYSTTDTWLTHGGAALWPSQKIFFTDDMKKLTQERIKNNKIREYPFLYAHLRSFYAWLFKCIKLEDLMTNSSFVPLSPSPDCAFFLPMVEMARNHIYCIPETAYQWNQRNPLSQYALNAQAQKEFAYKVFSWPSYQSLKEAQSTISTRYIKNKADVIILSQKKQQHIADIITSLRNQSRGINKIYVICSPDSQQDEEAYHTLADQFSNVDFIKRERHQACTTLLETLLIENPETEHVILTPDKISLVQPLDISQCIQELERTHAHSFYISKDRQKNSSHAPITSTLWAWHLHNNMPDHTSMVLYRKKDVKKYLESLKAITVQEFLNAWKQLPVDKRAIGLLFKKSPAAEL